MDIIQRIDSEIERRSLLKHSFYQMWSEGKLTIDHLQGYSKEYFQLVKAVPSFVQGIAKWTDDQDVAGNAKEEAEHVEPLEMSSYGPRTAFGVGMIHGVGAETGTQVLLIAAVGGAASAGLGIPMLLAFVLGLLISNLAIVVVTSVGFVASQTRERIYVVVGFVAGLFSLILGSIFLLSLDTIVPDMESLLPF